MGEQTESAATPTPFSTRIRDGAAARLHRVAATLEGLLPETPDPDVVRRIDEVFSRKMLGSVVVGSTVSQMLSKSVLLTVGTDYGAQLVAWAALFVAALALFVYWEHVEESTSKTAQRTAEKASEAAKKAAETVADDAEAAKEAAAAATDETSGDGGGDEPDDADESDEPD
ncbi:hypothetical protein [Halobaculum sp. P14]|uniref:hypothetical protein n=1 Tax=Halobaculum sp. P14 TaxID=3421638 RepID=UPI003EB96240